MLEESQAGLTQITENLQESDRLQNQAIRAVGAAAGFAAQTGMHAAQTGERAAKAAESALEANQLNGEAIKELRLATLTTKWGVERNELLTEAYRPHKLILGGQQATGGASVGVAIDESNFIQSVRRLSREPGIEIVVNTAGNTVWPGGLIVLNIQRGTVAGEDNSILIKAHAFDSGTNTLGVPAGVTKDGKPREIIRVFGVYMPGELMPKYRKELDALDAKYRGLGLEI